MNTWSLNTRIFVWCLLQKRLINHRYSVIFKWPIGYDKLQITVHDVSLKTFPNVKSKKKTSYRNFQICNNIIVQLHCRTTRR